jgi:hypothetical protein
MSTAPVAVVPDNIPTDAEIADDLRAAQPGVKLYRTSEDWWPFDFAGDHMWMPPDIPGHPLVEHPVKTQNGQPLMVPADGTVTVHDRYGPQLDEKTKKPAGFGLAKGQRAFDIAKLALRKHQMHGVVMLRGDAGDVKRKAKAKSLYNQYRRRWAEEQVAGRAKQVKNWQSQSKNHNIPPPDPSPLQAQAQEILDDLKIHGTKTLRYHCDSFCYATNDLDKFLRHLQAKHPKELELWHADNDEEASGAMREEERAKKMTGALGKRKKAGKKTA